MGKENHDGMNWYMDSEVIILLHMPVALWTGDISRKMLSIILPKPKYFVFEQRW